MATKAEREAAAAAKVAAAEAEAAAQAAAQGAAAGGGEQTQDQGGEGGGSEADPDDDPEANAAAAAGPAADAAAQAPATNAPAPAAPVTQAQKADPLAKILAEIVPEAGQRRDANSVALLMETCERFNVDPRAKKQPVELLAWRFIPGNPLSHPPIPDSVSIVTAGGVKLRHYEDPAFPMDPDTEERLAKIFNAYHADPKTKDVTRLPLPDNLALPVSAVTGEVVQQQHIMPGGYLRSQQPKDQAAAKRQADRLKKLGL